ncbi:hypothetical protein GCM10010277_73450 [Streptomyces longisporoflavus]|uniref:hypothetical protein n=1 Tax=Streptomyces longisporoflavus TaxID=28044 RepID=UPI00167D1D2F|nr:hypothetical protein [Streptomyces longisporoflavus]GGV65972.1 hypothetical protein GCM10010277_73450 [Streptomyces longisporoflavus]
MQPSPLPRISANELRPRRHWYATAAAIAIVLSVLGIAIGVHRFSNAIDAVDTGNQFADGDTLTLRLDPGHQKAIWIRDRGPSSDQACGITGPGEPGLADPGIDVFLTREETWNPLYTIDVPQTGKYTITCTSQGPSRYAIGDPGGFVTFGGWLMVAVLLPVLGVSIGATIALVTALRRRSHRKRLLAERQAPGGGHPVQPAASAGAGADRR